MLIALALTAILLTFLFSFFVESAKIEKKLETARVAISNRSHLQTRLQTVFSAIDRSTSEIFYTKQFEKEKSVSLITIFNNGIDPDPAYSGSVTGRIFIDPEKNLCLATWPLDKSKNRPWRKEILLSHIERLEFEFLGKRSASDSGKKEKIRPINAMFAWRELWSPSQAGIPSIIRLSVWEEKQKEPLRFAFILLTSEPLVTYIGKKAV